MHNPKIHAHVPYLSLSRNLDYILRKRLNTEIYFSSDGLDSCTPEHLETAARQLRAAGLSTTIHATFMDLNPGAQDPIIREATRARFIQIFEAAAILRPHVIVFHPGLDEVRHGNNREQWLANSIVFWREFVPLAEELHCTIAVENIFEQEPSSLRALLDAIDHPLFRHCFDVGHWNMFSSVTLEQWFDVLGSYIAEAHLHDNHGKADEHLPVGEGEIAFTQLFRLLERFAPEATWTLEAHSIERLERALINIRTYL